MDPVGRVNMRYFITMLGLAVALSFGHVAFAADNGWGLGVSKRWLRVWSQQIAQ
jgi:hypothetical protein